MTTPPATPTDANDPAAWVTRVAFYGLIALVVARATILEILREPAGFGGGPRGAGAGTTVVLDLLGFVPALLVLGRRVVDRTYVLRLDWSHAAMAALGAWALASTTWSADRFAAAVGALTFASALALLWAASQLVRSAMRLRAVAAACFGLLLVFIAHGLIMHFVDQPATQEYWEQSRAEMLADRGWNPDDPRDAFTIRQFEARLFGELVGFSASPNSFAAAVLLASAVAGGLAWQRWRDGDEWGWAGAVGFALPLAGLLLWWTGSKGAMGGALLVAVGLAVAASGWLSRLSHRTLFLAGLGAFVAGAVAVVAYGVATGGLPSASLLFRWRYWAGGWGVFASNPLLGVGYENFADAYLAHRLPSAAEEVRDPHNLFVRAFAELGVIGGLLAVAWLVRLAWEVTRTPKAASAPLSSGSRGEVAWLFAAAFLAVGVNAAASIDFSQVLGFWLFELFKRGMFLALLVIGFAVGALRSRDGACLDGRPAPLALAAMVVGLGVFLVLNLVDFSLFESGPMALTALVAGAASGATTPSVAGRRSRTPVAVGAFAVAALAWIVAAVGFAVPLLRAESLAASARSAERDRPLAAARDFEAAFDAAPVSNADYLFDASRAVMTSAATGDPAGQKQLIDRAALLLARAAAANPAAARYPLELARLERSLPPGVRDDQVVADRFAEAVARNPNDVDFRLEYADALAEAGRPDDARQQYAAALAANNALPADEPKRLSPERVAEVRGQASGIGQ